MKGIKNQDGRWYILIYRRTASKMVLEFFSGLLLLALTVFLGGVLYYFGLALLHEAEIEASSVLQLLRSSLGLTAALGTLISIFLATLVSSITRFSRLSRQREDWKEVGKEQALAHWDSMVVSEKEEIDT